VAGTEVGATEAVRTGVAEIAAAVAVDAVVAAVVVRRGADPAACRTRSSIPPVPKARRNPMLNASRKLKPKPEPRTGMSLVTLRVR
jgi:hypothetical protein